MANYVSFLVTEQTFRVKDLEAFKAALAPAQVDWGSNVKGQECAPSFDGLTGVVEEDGSIWLGGYDASLRAFDEEGEEVGAAQIIQAHLADGEVAVFMTVGHERLRGVDGYVTVVTKDDVRGKGLYDVMDELLKAPA